VWNETTVGFTETTVDEAAQNLSRTTHKCKQSRQGLKGELGGGAGFLDFKREAFFERC